MALPKEIKCRSCGERIRTQGKSEGSCPECGTRWRIRQDSNDEFNDFPDFDNHSGKSRKKKR